MGIEFKEKQLEERPDRAERLRKCLMCGKEFLSTWAGNRICQKCRSKSDYRSGV